MLNLTHKDSNAMKENLQAKFRQDLSEDESLLWTGQPRPGLFFQAQDLFLFPFGIFWLAFSIFWTFMAAQASVIFALFGIPFVLVGLMLVFGRFFVDALSRNKTIYGITDQRIIIKSGLFNTSIKSFNIKDIPNIEYTERKDGSGTIIIGQNLPDITRHASAFGFTVNNQLRMIPGVRKVYNQIIELQKN